MRRRQFLIACACAACSSAALGSDWIEPHMHFLPAAGAQQVAVTLDACMGDVDERILDVLVTNNIAATIFATRRWLDHNAAAIKTLRAHPDLFVVENHGAEHVACAIGNEDPYGLPAAKTANGVFAEVIGGQQAVTSAFGAAPKWFRDAGAVYTKDAIALIGAMNLQIAGFSLNGDIGASVSTDVALARISAAKSGDVIISHINQPKRPAGAGVAAALLLLKSKGFSFVHLDDVQIARIA